MDYMFSFFIYATGILCATFGIKYHMLVNRRNTKRICLIITIIVPALIAGLRYNVGTDYLMYEKSYYAIATGKSIGRYVDFEIGYYAINKLIYVLNGEFWMVMFIMQFFTMFFIYKAIKNESNFIDSGFAMLTYMCFYYLSSLNLVRQSLAIAICIYAITCINRKPLYYFFIFIGIATLFHKSSLVCLGILLVKFIFENYKKRWLHLLLFVVLLLLVFNRNIIGKLVGSFFGKYYENYFTMDVDGSGGFVNYVLRLTPFIFSFYIGLKKLLHNRQYSLYFNLWISGCILGLLGRLTATYVDRVAYFFTYLSFLLIAYVVNNISSYNKNFIKCGMIIFMFVMWFYDFFYKGYAQTIPYQFLWSH